MTILVTGGAGYIGSHTCVELLSAGFEVIILDNFVNSHPEVISRIEKITGKKLAVINGDVRDQALVEESLKKYSCTAVMHFAGLKAVGDSVKNPLAYYDNNFVGTHRLLLAMQNCGVEKIVFSSSATVYGEPQYLPITEDHPLSATNPYGRSKLFIEEMLRDFHHANPSWKIVLLRYFNPAGAHESGLMGEDPMGLPNNLMPYTAQVATGRREYLSIWGNDYATHDGTGVRDYIHVVDLALGHLKALQQLNSSKSLCLNLGAGIGYSVLDIVHTFEKTSGKKIPYQIDKRRSGDIAVYYADPTLARESLDWMARRDLVAICKDHWRWQKQNPKGYT